MLTQILTAIHSRKDCDGGGEPDTMTDNDHPHDKRGAWDDASSGEWTWITKRSRWPSELWEFDRYLQDVKQAEKLKQGIVEDDLAW